MLMVEEPRVSVPRVVLTRQSGSSERSLNVVGSDKVDSQAEGTGRRRREEWYGWPPSPTQTASIVVLDGQIAVAATRGFGQG